jgi:hypothetical protein
MRTLLAAALAVSVSTVAAAAIPGRLVGLFALGDSLANLTVLSLDPNTGANATLGYVTLGPIQQTFPARSTYDPSTGQLLVAVATATHIYGVDVTTGAATQLAALPKYDGTDPYLGLIRVNGVNYFITQSTLYILDKANTVLQRVSTLPGLPDDALVTADPKAGTNGEGMIYLGNATIPHHNSTLLPLIWRVDLGKDNAVDHISVRGGGGRAGARADGRVSLPTRGGAGRGRSGSASERAGKTRTALSAARDVVGSFIGWFRFTQTHSPSLPSLLSLPPPPLPCSRTPP